jgi:hypothetical protein
MAVSSDINMHVLQVCPCHEGKPAKKDKVVAGIESGDCQCANGGNCTDLLCGELIVLICCKGHWQSSNATSSCLTTGFLISKGIMRLAVVACL